MIVLNNKDCLDLDEFEISFKKIGNFEKIYEVVWTWKYHYMNGRTISRLLKIPKQKDWCLSNFLCYLFNPSLEIVKVPKTVEVYISKHWKDKKVISSLIAAASFLCLKDRYTDERVDCYPMYYNISSVPPEVQYQLALLYIDMNPKLSELRVCLPKTQDFTKFLFGISLLEQKSTEKKVFI